MWLKQWKKLPENMQNDAVREYYDILKHRRISLFLKRVFDILFSLLGIIVLSPVLLVLSIMIKVDSKGPVLFKQVRVKQYGKTFKIYKFRTMVVNAEKLGTQLTTQNDSRITRVGNMIRKCRLDEFPQLFNILKGDMSFVGARPEVVKYVKAYTPEMMATLLLPQGVTALSSIKFKDESDMLGASDDPENTYIQDILPIKMKYNLEYLKNFSLWEDIKLICATVYYVLK